MDEYQASGRLVYHYQGSDGYLCNEYFTENDAKVACHEIGKSNGFNYTGGIPFTPLKDVEGPFFIGEANCTGTEGRLKDCASFDKLCWHKFAASVLCFQNQGKTRRFVDFTSFFSFFLVSINLYYN